MELVLRFDYGHIVPWVRRDRDGGLTAVAGPDAMHLIAGRPTRGQDLTTFAEFELEAGDEVPFVLTWFPSHEPAPLAVDGLAATEDTTAWWRAWSARSTDRGPYRDLVQRSLITLKALTYAPTGGIVAAPTTSLPEAIGGVRNWDYRYCWVRDATLTLQALIARGLRRRGERLARLAAARRRRAAARAADHVRRGGRAAAHRARARLAAGLRGLDAGAHRQRRLQASSSSTCSAS